MTTERLREIIDALGWTSVEFGAWTSNDPRECRRMYSGKIPVPAETAAVLERRLASLLTEPPGLRPMADFPASRDDVLVWVPKAGWFVAAGFRERGSGRLQVRMKLPPGAEPYLVEASGWLPLPDQVRWRA